jgi:hypothetical protein
MPDTRRHRGPHPEDARLFDESQHDTLRAAVAELAWLLTRGYAEESALALVGNRHNLTERQRTAVRRSTCSDESLRRRAETHVAPSDRHGCKLGIDGYNLLITVESALSKGVVLIGRDGCCRDLASIHGTYHKVEETLPAVRFLVEHLEQLPAESVDWYLDRPVSNSGRLKVLIAEVVETSRTAWNVELVDNPDPLLAAYEGVVVTSDSWILDRCRAWTNLAAEIIRERIPDCWMIRMS